MGVETYPPVTAIPRIDYSRLLVASSPIPLAHVRRVNPNYPYEVINPTRDVWGVVNSLAVEVDGTLLYVQDSRHSHNWDHEDLTEFETTSATYVTIVEYDYGSVVSAKEILLRLSLWCVSAGITAYLRVSVSEDGVTYTTIAELSTTSTSEVLYPGVKAYGVSLRYLRFELRSSSEGYRVRAIVRKIAIVR